MAEVGLLDVWKLLCVIIARQSPFEQVMIAVGGALFIVMAIEGMRTSIVAMRSAAVVPAPPQQQVAETSAAAMVPPPPASQLRSERFVPRVATRPLGRVTRKVKPVTFAKDG